MTGFPVTIDGERLLLLPQKAIYWPAEKVLIIADIHFGKAGAFRALGVPVPGGTTSQNLAALDGLIAAYDVRHILFLGDFLHAKSTAASSLRAMQAWRDRHPDLRLTLVRGNHDLNAGDPPQALRIHVVDEPHRIRGFAFCHHPSITSDAYVMAGHVHPAYRLSSRYESLRMPCFVIGRSRAILPSFGAFTGAYTITRQAEEKIFVIADDAVIAVNHSK
ncbi:ligase-associated DNA damage response endonuclease PdeM [Undibacterium sp. TJN25]|uniref:ligase-associated DNA damage response endonuclease PdeM n=1 Tax=Undibacterium sp. TJN25 TaxID=3413056 RepID=UPI003BF26DAB